VKLLNKILFIFIAILAITCDDPNDSSSASSNSTLDDSNAPGNGTAGNIDDYLFDLDAGQTPYVNSKFYRYSGLSIIEPLAFDESSDTLNFSTIGDYVLSFSPNEVTADMVTIELLDESVMGDVNGDDLITDGEFNDLYRYEEVNFSHSFTDVLKLEWDEDNERYLVVSVPADASPLSHKYYIGDPNVLYDGLPPDTTDVYDSLVYITQINYNDLAGFSFTNEDDANGNGLLDEGEDWELDDSFTNQYYFDQNELITSDSTHSLETAQISHNFNYDKNSLSIDSLVFKISTDCNDNGIYDGVAETEASSESDCQEGEIFIDDQSFGFCDKGNGIWDPAEPFLNQGGAGDTEYDIGEPFLDRNCNGVWDGAEEYLDADGNGEFDEGEEFTDMGNGQYDEAEVCADGSSGCSLENLYTMSDRPNVLIASYTGNDWEVFEEIDADDIITQRWSDTEYHIIETYPETTVKTKAVPMVDRVETIYSYQFIENTYADENDYSIAKTVWYDDADRNTNYHLFRKDDATGNIMQLTHDSYFVLPTTTPGASIDGGSFEDYIVFDNFPSEQTYLYTYNGLLRDGEKHQSTRQSYSAETNAIYNITETYEVNSTSVTIPQLNGLYDDGETYEDDNGNGEFDEGEESYTDEFTILDDVFVVSRTKKSIMQGSGVELVEVNNIWLAKDYGIVKDEMEFRFNEPDDFDGFYRLELVDRYGRGSNRSTFYSPSEINFNEFELIDGAGDSYKKTRNYGLQKLEFDKQ
tara:strand:+ start:744 stop:2999 length:2256 start_codon:yes stop_codon:yes gene_type:complete